MNKISIIIPCYNSFFKMNKCLDSLVNQTNKNFEVIFIDDKSTDDTFNALKDYLLKEANFKYQLYVNNENKGPGKSRNFGISKVSYKYMTFLDSDDYFDHNAVDKILQVLNAKHYDSVVFDYFKDSNGRRTLQDTIKYLDSKELLKDEVFNYIIGSTWCKVYSTNIIIENNVLFPDLKRSEDMPFTKIAILNSDNIYYLKEGLYNYYINDSSLMNDNSLLNENNAIASFNIIAKELERKDSLHLVERLFLTEIMYSTTYTMFILKKNHKEIIANIDFWTKKYPSWKNWINKYKIPRMQKYFLNLTSKKRLRTLKLLVKTREFVKR